MNTLGLDDVAYDQSSAGTPRSRVKRAVLVTVLILLGLGLGGFVAIVIGFLTGWIQITC